MVAVNNPKPISVYIKAAEGWDEIDKQYLMVPKDFEPYTCSFVRRDGVQMLATMVGRKEIHVTIAPLNSCQPDLTEKEMGEYIENHASEVLKTFLAGREVALLPKDERFPYHRHYLVKV